MTNILIFDTETSGFPHKSKPLKDPSQPWVAQLAWNYISSQHDIYHSILIQSQGREMTEGAEKVHGLSVNYCDEHGRPESEALDLFLYMLEQTDVVVGHNVKFDRTLMFIMSARNEIFKEWPPAICTMLSYNSICCLPGRGSAYKWPKLEEAYKYVTGDELEGAHDALIDVKATRKIFNKLTDEDHIYV